MTHSPMKPFICGSFNVVVATVDPVDALGLDVQCDTGRPSQFGPNDSIPVGAIHEGSLQARLAI